MVEADMNAVESQLKGMAEVLECEVAAQGMRA